MFRLSSCLSKTKNILYRRRPSKLPFVYLSRSAPSLEYKRASDPARDPCPPPPKLPPPPPKDDRLLWGTIAMMVVAGGFAVYAKQSPEVRDWVTIHAPWFDDIIAVMYQENMTYLEFVTSCVEQLKRKVDDYFDDKKPKECSYDMDVPEKPADYEEPVDDESLTEQESPCDLLPPPVITKDICEVEACIKDLAENILNNYITARDACLFYNTLVFQTMQKFSFPASKQLAPEMETRKDLVAKSIANIEAAQASLSDLSRYLECGVQASPERINHTKQILADYYDQIGVTRTQYQWANDRSGSLDCQWQRVSAIVEKYAEENESMYLGLDYMNEKPKIRGDPDFLLQHTGKYVTYLIQKFKDESEGMTHRLDRAIASIPKPDKDKDALIQAAFKKAQGDMAREYSNRMAAIQKDNEDLKNRLLKNQREEYEKNLASRMKVKEAEIMVKFRAEVARRVADEKKRLQNELNQMRAKLKAVEDTLKARLKAERDTKRSQQLWSAGASLLGATKKGDDRINVNKELKAIEKASVADDKMVTTILKAIPNTVWEEGVVPESVLRKKYHTMEQVALRVALVEHEGAPLPLYLVSWLQSMLLFMKLSTIPQAEIDNPPKEPYNFQHLDTFDLLQRARYFIERGNIAAAVRYVSALEGASRGAAHAWYEAARAHLETRQAAEAVIAHAVAMGLQYI